MATTKKKARSKFQSNLNRSYATYLKWRGIFEEKGYTLVPAMSKSAYREKYREAVDMHLHNIPREFARHDIVVTYREAQQIRKFVEKEKKKREKRKKKRKQLGKSELPPTDRDKAIDEFGQQFPSLADLLKLNISRKELFELLVRIRTKDGDIFGKGWMTRRQVEELFGY